MSKIKTWLLEKWLQLKKWSLENWLVLTYNLILLIIFLVGGWFTKILVGLLIVLAVINNKTKKKEN